MAVILRVGIICVLMFTPSNVAKSATSASSKSTTSKCIYRLKSQVLNSCAFENLFINLRCYPKGLTDIIESVYLRLFLTLSEMWQFQNLVQE